MLKGIICDGLMKLWWKAKNVKCEGNLKPFVYNKYAMELANYAVKNKCEVGNYVEHTILKLNDVDGVCFEVKKHCVSQKEEGPQYIRDDQVNERTWNINVSETN